MAAPAVVVVVVVAGAARFSPSYSIAFKGNGKRVPAFQRAGLSYRLVPWSRAMIALQGDLVRRGQSGKKRAFLAWGDANMSVLS